LLFIDSGSGGMFKYLTVRQNQQEEDSQTRPHSIRMPKDRGVTGAAIALKQV